MRTDSIIRTARTLNFHLYDPNKTSGKFRMPRVERCELTPQDVRLCKLKAIDKAIHYEGDCSNKILHFYSHDFFFERLWNKPERYLPLLKKYYAVVMPDYSLWSDMSLALQMFNSYRSKLLAQYWQSQGIEVIPSPHWTSSDSFDFVFDGLPIGGLFAISTTGSDESMFSQGFEEFLMRKKPSSILLFGQRTISGANCELIRATRNTKKGAFEWGIQGQAA